MNDIDGSKMVIFSEEEARRIWDIMYCKAASRVAAYERIDTQIRLKLARDLNIESER
jgi:hypothetical protein